MTDEDGRPLRDGDALWLTATSAGPGFFDTAHTSVWRLDPDEPSSSTHAADLFFRRPDRPGVFGDHATHLVRSTGGWLVATSTWGDFETPTTRAGRRTPSGLRVTLAESDADLLRGTHVLDTRELPLPTDGLASIATWDPHLVRRDGEWLVGFVSARRFFDFHPALAGGPGLDDLRLLRRRHRPDRHRGHDAGGGRRPDWSCWRATAATRRAACGRGSRSSTSRCARSALLDAPYPTNLPWPTLAQVDDGWLMATFDGRAGRRRRCSATAPTATSC